MYRMKIRDPETGGIVYVGVIEAGTTDPADPRDTTPDGDLSDGLAEVFLGLRNYPGWIVDYVESDPEDDRWAVLIETPKG